MKSCTLGETRNAKPPKLAALVVILRELDANQATVLDLSF